MSSSIDTLPLSKKSVAQDFIGLLLALKPLAVRFNDQIKAFRTRLEQCKSKEQYLGVVHDIVNKEREIEVGLMKAELKNMDPQLQIVVKECVETNANLLAVREAWHINEALSDSLNSTQERLSKAAIFDSLPEEKQQVLQQFIAGIHSLEPLVAQTKQHLQYFKKQLAQAQTLADIDKIEAEIVTRSKQRAAEFSKLVTYPSDEETASALIQFLQANQHLLTIIQSFDEHEIMLDDIIHARVAMRSLTEISKS